MAYTAYFTEQVFSDPLLNTLSDRLMNYVDSHATFPTTSIALTGQAARMVAGDTPVAPIRAVIFITADKQLFSSLKSELKNLWPRAAVVSFADRYQINYNDRFIEIWFSATGVTTVNVDDIILQDSNEIPANLL